jgi:hypothetical protein
MMTPAKFWIPGSIKVNLSLSGPGGQYFLPKKSSTRPERSAQIDDRQNTSLICEESENDTFRDPINSGSGSNGSAATY